MSRTDSSFDIRAEHPKRVHVDREMKEIRVKKAARDELPHLESDGIVELGYIKMANRPEREAREQPWAGYRFQSENGDVYADQQSCESRHKNSLAACAYFRTKVTKDHGGHNVTEICLSQQRRASLGKERNKFFAVPGISLVNAKEFPVFLRHSAC